MSVTQSLRMAVKSILSNKVRSLLTMLGIIIGVAAVIVIVGLGNGMQVYMRETFDSLGVNLIGQGGGGAQGGRQGDAHRRPDLEPWRHPSGV